MKASWPRRAMILAAGRGRRLEPLTRQLPKPLWPLWGQPLLSGVLEALADWGVTDVLINTHQAAAALWDAARQVRPRCPRLTLTYEPELLGTGGGLLNAAWFFDPHPFWLINADLTPPPDPGPLCRALAQDQALAALWIDCESGPRSVQCDGSFIRALRGGQPGAPDSATFCGLQLVQPRLFTYLRAVQQANGAADLVAAYTRALADGERLAARELPAARWSDYGTPERYLAAHAGPRRPRAAGLYSAAALRRAGARLEGWAAVDASVAIAPGCQLRESVVWPGARLEADAVLDRAIVATGAVVRGPVSGLVAPATIALTPAELDWFGKQDWPLTETTVAILPPRGSDRQFLRLRAPDQTAMLIRYGVERKENEAYAPLARFLARQDWPVPKVLAHQPKQRRLVLEEIAGPSLEVWAATRRPADVETAYRRVLDHVAQLHGRITAAAARRRLPLQKPLDARLFAWEHDLFFAHCAQRHLGWHTADCSRWRASLARLAVPLAAAPRTLVHRDLQSSNIIWRQSAPVFLDFQGLRWGPAAYDLASLLGDPYVSLPRTRQLALLDYYNRLPGARPCPPDLFWPAMIQRLTQALGAYGRLAALPGGEHFAIHIPPALKMLQRACAQADVAPPALGGPSGILWGSFTA